MGSQRPLDEDLVVGEQDEAALLTELPQTPPAHEIWEALAALNFAIATRTIVAAARGGRLRELDADFFTHDSNLDGPFAVRALLPCWVGIQDWTGGWCECWTKDSYKQNWMVAARALRPALARASLRLGRASSSGPRAQRQLRRQDVQALLTAHLEGVNAYNGIALYLEWLHEDSELAERVADAWNAVVERGAADVHMCE